MSVKKLERKQKPAEPVTDEALRESEELAAETAEETTEAITETEAAKIASEEPAAESEEAQEAEEPEEPEEPKKDNKKKPLYQVAYRRDDAVLEAFITFNYRVVHPKVFLRSILYAIVFISFGIVSGASVFGVICFLLAAFCLGVVAFRKKISLSMTKKDDLDYQNGTLFTFNFTETAARMLRNNKPEVYAKSYKKSVTAFFEDQSFYYIALSSNDLFILPKDKFTIGDPEEFREFIIKRTEQDVRWIPFGMKGVLNSLKNFSEQPMIDTEGWKEMVGNRIARSRAEKAETRKKQAEENAKNASVKPKSLKDNPKKDKGK